VHSVVFCFEGWLIHVMVSTDYPSPHDAGNAKIQLLRKVSLYKQPLSVLRLYLRARRLPERTGLGGLA
jgi:hypothetical protein